MNATVLLTSVDINIPGYRILSPIGEGGMASVFLAVQESLDREVALKVMSPVLAANTEFASRFLTEGKITAKLQHPNLVTVYDIGSHAGVYYLAAEYIPGGTLKERISQGGLSVAHILDIATDIAQGLDFAHEKGFVHRDVKPGNVLFRKDGRVVLADFGIAKAMDGSNSSTVAGSSIGTPDYMSPEQARGEPVDGRSDLYSLGTVLYEMLTGTPPYQAGDPFTVALMHVTHPVPALPEPYEWLQPLVSGLMAKDAAQRYNTGAAFVDALHKLVEAAPQGAVLQETSARKAGGGGRIAAGAATQQRTRISARQSSGRPAWLWPAAGVGVFGAAVLAWWLLTPATAPPSQSQPQGPAAQPTAATPATETLPESFQMPQPVDTANQDEVDRLLNAGDKLYEYATQVEVGRKLDYPDDDSALGYYRRVLAIDPENARARAGVASVVAFYRSYAHKACDRGEWVQCGFLVRKGLAVDGEDPYLRQLQDAVATAESGGTPALPAAPPSS
ncbi:serine/threonine-protein kinase [Arenimonas terrae]|uniref:non-specific serine/threonine protein kinase n=1 Tax=Arenimonas terrae TaxID=2546226 RepID=A0A5C4RWM2_9GAMM|nr:serine/threonine-protein kinase [Arenimonas terrae]TNJ35097.1 serine/threonine protein kinase [Arenimonas terrae]